MSDINHPGKTPAQRRVLDEIGCGNYSPIMAKATRDGLIEELPPLESRAGPFRMIIRQFQMPVPVHMQWCTSVESELESAELDKVKP